MSDMIIISQQIGGINAGECSADIDGIKLSAKTREELDVKIHEHMMDVDEGYRDRFNEDTATDLDIKIVETDDWYLGCQSLVGVGGRDFPLSHGNYFSFIINAETKDAAREAMIARNDYSCINMWAENFDEALKTRERKDVKFVIFYDACCAVLIEGLEPEWYIKEPFMKYNLHKGLTPGQKQKIREWFNEQA